MRNLRKLLIAWLMGGRPNSSKQILHEAHLPTGQTTRLVQG